MFDIEGAKKAGYSDAEIADHLAYENKFDSAAARQSGYSDAEIISHLQQPTQQPQSATVDQPIEQPADPNTLVDMAKGAARGGLEGVTGLPTMALDALAYYPRKGIEKLTGKDLSENDPRASYLERVGQNLLTPSQTYQELYDQIISAPETTAGRLTRDVSSGITGALTGVGIGKGIVAPAGSKLAALGNLLSAAPKSQALAGATSGLAAGSTREMGGSPVAQLLAGLAGGIAAPMVLPKSVGGITVSAPQVSRQATAVQNAKDLGYTLPPSQANPTFINKLLEGIAGKLTTAQKASMKNQDISNALVRKDFGLSDDVELSPDLFKSIRDSAGQAYEKIGNIGKIVADQDYFNALGNIAKRNRSMEADFPAMVNTKIDDAVQRVAVPEFDARSGIETIKQLRDDANINFAVASNAEKAAAKASKSAADAIENLLGRTLEKSGDADLLRAFRDARKTIAMTYSAEKALNPTTGNIIASKLANQLSENKPLSGNLKKIAEAGQAFPAATKETLTSMPMTSPLDAWASMATAVSSGNPLALAGMFVRPTIRAGILSKAYQNAATTPNNLDLLKLLKQTTAPSLIGSNTQNR